MDTYLNRFFQMVEELRNSDNLNVLHFNTFPPVNDKVIKNIEESYTIKLAPTIKRFFKQTNGLQLRWRFNDDKLSDPDITVDESNFLYPLEDYLKDTGIINILPLEKIFFYDWKDIVWFDSDKNSETTFFDVTYNTADFGKNLKPLDVFSKDRIMAFFVGDKSSDPKVLFGEDHCADFTSSKVTNFESYMEFLIAKKGVVAERANFYLDNWGSSMKTKDLLVTPRGYWTEDKIFYLR